MNSAKRVVLLSTSLLTAIFCLAHSPFALAAVHVWEKQELTFTSTNSYVRPYTEVVVWVDLKGPGFSKRVYGFWDGGRSFKVRLVATKMANAFALADGRVYVTRGLLDTITEPRLAEQKQKLVAQLPAKAET